MQKPIMYLASPYSHPDEAVRNLRYLAARDTAAQLMLDGTLVFSPIVHCRWLSVDCGLRDDMDFWREYDFAMIEALPRFGILELPGWSRSKGIKEETDFANSIERIPRMISPVGTYADVLNRFAAANLDI